MMVDIVFQKDRRAFIFFTLFLKGLFSFFLSFFLQNSLWKACQLDFMDNLYQLVFSSNSIFYEF